jgi:predicted nucleic acid-binding protein
MPADAFFDTNVLLYSIAEDDPRSARAEALLEAGGIVGVQGLNEFVSVTRSKIGLSWTEVREALEAILILCPAPVPITLATHQLAVGLAERYRYSIYDALVLSAAIQAKCKTIYSEDLQDGQIIDNKVVIRNPFT